MSGLRNQNRFGGMWDRIIIREILHIRHGMKWTHQDWDMLLFVEGMRDVFEIEDRI